MLDHRRAVEEAPAPFQASLQEAGAATDPSSAIKIYTSLLPSFPSNHDAWTVPSLLAQAHADAGSWDATAAEEVLHVITSACLLPSTPNTVLLVLLELLVSDNSVPPLLPPYRRMWSRPRTKQPSRVLSRRLTRIGPHILTYAQY